MTLQVGEPKECIV